MVGSAEKSLERYTFPSIEALAETIFAIDGRITVDNIWKTTHEWSDRGRDYLDVVNRVASRNRWLALSCVVEEARKVANLPSAKEEDEIYRQRAIVEMTFLKMLSVKLSDRRCTPEEAGIYFIKREQEVVYVGSSVNIRARLTNTHEKLKLIPWQEMEHYTVSWYLYKQANLHRLERYWIAHYKPAMNIAWLTPID